MKCKTCHGKNEKKGEFGSFRSESLCFKWGSSIMLKPSSIMFFIVIFIGVPFVICFHCRMFCFL